eukprot:TRINITY_DN5720_c0_g1_i2.p1 TRINITY_DN5720_c0_g1~~TRINITY_DN5720_c0_g1_i2.p1  ORF type:complete len:216 (+),score=18.11 TRINITY_DN5720_c0_g1_i2:37-648(+)
MNYNPSSQSSQPSLSVSSVSSIAADSGRAVSGREAPSLEGLSVSAVLSADISGRPASPWHHREAKYSYDMPDAFHPISFQDRSPSLSFNQQSSASVSSSSPPPVPSSALTSSALTSSALTSSALTSSALTSSSLPSMASFSFSQPNSSAYSPSNSFHVEKTLASPSSGVASPSTKLQHTPRSESSISRDYNHYMHLDRSILIN